MWKNNDVTRRLNLSVPIVQGPFGGGLSSIELAVTVSNMGGLGSFGAHHLSGVQIAQLIQDIRAKTKRSFAINLWVPHEDSDEPKVSTEQFDAALKALAPYFKELNLPLPSRPERFSPRYQEQIDALLEARPPAFSFVFGVPNEKVLQRCRDLNIVTLGAATTPDEAIALDRAGVDMVVASGFEAGGHRVSFLRSAETSLTGTFALIPQVVEAVTVPVIAAGGIVDGRGVAAALMLGAQAVQIGTAFLACKESAASELHRQKLFSEDARYTALTRTFSGRLARGIGNRFMQEMQARLADIAMYPVQNWLTGQMKPRAIAQHRADLISLWSGQGAPLLKHRDAASLMSALIAETSAALTKYSSE